MRKSLTSALLPLALVCSTTSWGAPYILSDVFSDDDPIILNIYDQGPNQALRYRQYGPVTFSESGIYDFYDARDAVTYFELYDGIFLNNDITVSVHSAPLVESDILASLVQVADDYDEFELEAGREYWIVVQPFSQGDGQRELAFVFDGPGTVSGGDFKALPEIYRGTFDDNDPLTNIIPEFVGCADSYYEMSGPHRVGQTGNYYASNYATYREDSFSIAFGVYEGSFDPDNPYENQIAVGPNGTQVFLEEGTDYFFVVQPDCDIVQGDYQFVVMPPADTFLWSVFAGGSYADPAVPSQGALFDVLTETGAVFMAWFTFANTMPDSNADSDVGSAEQRWMVGFGTWDDPRDPVLDLTLFKSEGGMFNMPDSAENVPQPEVGTMRVDMTDRCEGGIGTYTLDSGLSGTVNFRRIASDRLIPCINQNPRPGPWFDWRVD